MTPGRPYAEVIGDPVSHSKSPLIHSFWLGKLGIAADYRATKVARAGLAEFIAARRRDPDWRGCNVTMPLKLDALLLADEASDRAVTTGAANLLLPKDGALLAGNTDVGGVLQVLGPFLERGQGGPVTLLGNGGAARAALVALRMLNVVNVRIQARDISSALKLAVEFELEEGPRADDMPIDSEGLVNATPVGMAGVDPVPFDISRMPAGGWVFDMVTEPAMTPLLLAARERGLATADGLAMLVEQAAASFLLFFGAEAPRQFDGELMKALRP